jgi:ACR3 family arsenite transporter
MKLSLRMIIFPIFVAVSMSLGLLLGLKVHVYSSSVATYGIPVGLFFMIYPVMTKVRLEELGKSIRDLKTLGLMVLLNYAVDPFLVAGLAYLFFYGIYDRLGLLASSITSQALVGVILLGVAPCIAMVIVWTDLAGGNLALGVSFIAWNSVIQIITTPILVYILTRTSVIINPLLILESVLLYLLIPLIAGIITRRTLQRKNIFSKILKALDNVQTAALLFTIVMIFWGGGYGVISHPFLIWMIGAVMLVFYFVLFHMGYFVARFIGYNYADSTAIGFTVSARDFEVSIAIAVTAFSAYPYVAVTTTIGPLLEIPFMLLLVWIQLLRREKDLLISSTKFTEPAK